MLRVVGATGHAADAQCVAALAHALVLLVARQLLLLELL
jgi:hypothetical protein